MSFNFNVNLEMVSRKGVVDVSPMSGKVFANDRQRIIVRFKPGIPERIVETLMLEIAHFLPVEFKVGLPLNPLLVPLFEKSSAVGC